MEIVFSIFALDAGKFCSLWREFGVLLAFLSRIAKTPQVLRTAETPFLQFPLNIRKRSCLKRIFVLLYRSGLYNKIFILHCRYHRFQ